MLNKYKNMSHDERRKEMNSLLNEAEEFTWEELVHRMYLGRDIMNDLKGSFVTYKLKGEKLDIIVSRLEAEGFIVEVKESGNITVKFNTEDHLTVGQMYDRMWDFSDATYSREFKCIKSDKEYYLNMKIKFSCCNIIHEESETVGMSIMAFPPHSMWIEIKEEE